jgi:hypothetical protein
VVPTPWRWIGTLDENLGQLTIAVTRKRAAILEPLTLELKGSEARLCGNRCRSLMKQCFSWLTAFAQASPVFAEQLWYM